jgi:hypothetical protein
MKMRATGLLLLALLPPVFAQTPLAKPLAPSKDGVEGLLVNSTVSADGMAFFLSFVDAWREKPGSDKYTIEVAERASKRLGNQIWVAAGQKRIFFSNLPIQRDRIRTLGEQAAETGYAAMITLSLPFGGEVDPDVAEDEL